EYGFYVAAPLAAQRRRRWPWLALVPLLALGAWLLLARGGADAPPVAPGAVALGSALPKGGVRSVDCANQAPSRASRAGRLGEVALPGRALVAPYDGAIHAWAVRGAHGELALQVIRGGYAAPLTAQFQHVADTGVHVLPADLTVHAGDHVGVQLAP